MIAKISTCSAALAIIVESRSRKSAERGQADEPARRTASSAIVTPVWASYRALRVNHFQARGRPGFECSVGDRGHWPPARRERRMLVRALELRTASRPDAILGSGLNLHRDQRLLRRLGERGSSRSWTSARRCPPSKTLRRGDRKRQLPRGENAPDGVTACGSNDADTNGNQRPSGCRREHVRRPSRDAVNSFTHPCGLPSTTEPGRAGRARQVRRVCGQVEGRFAVGINRTIARQQTPSASRAANGELRKLQSRLVARYLLRGAQLV